MMLDEIRKSLTPSTAVIFDEIREKERVTDKEIIMALIASGCSRKADRDVLRVQLCYLRKALKDTGWNIRTFRRSSFRPHTSYALTYLL